MSTLQPASAMLLRTLVGTADSSDGAKFEMSLVNAHMPAVKDMKTGVTYVFSWDDLIKQAVAAGISLPG